MSLILIMHANNCDKNRNIKIWMNYPLTMVVHPWVLPTSVYAHIKLFVKFYLTI